MSTARDFKEGDILHCTTTQNQPMWLEMQHIGAEMYATSGGYELRVKRQIQSATLEVHIFHEVVQCTAIHIFMRIKGSIPANPSITILCFSLHKSCTHLSLRVPVHDCKHQTTEQFRKKHSCSGKPDQTHMSWILVQQSQK